MGGYLANAGSIPAASAVPVTLTAIFANANLTSLYTLVENARRGQNRFILDCFGNPLYKLTLGARTQAVDMREIVDVPTLLTAIETYFPAGCRAGAAAVEQVVNAVVPVAVPASDNVARSESVLEQVLDEVGEKK